MKNYRMYSELKDNCGYYNIVLVVMKFAPRVVNLLGKSKVISEPLTFPLSAQTLKEIEDLKLTFRNSFEEHQVYSLGISAPQIGVNKRFFIMPKSFAYGLIKDFRRLKYVVRQFNVYINPSIISKSVEQNTQVEYCLSVGQNQYKVKRPALIEVQYFKEDGTPKIEKLDSLRSRVFQHQFDHLEGILMSEFGEKIPSLKQKDQLRLERTNKPILQ